MREVKVPNWLERLPLAPEYFPTDTEFSDPIAYISKIEKEASKFGICKVIPPLPKPSKKYTLSNLNRSLSKQPELGPDVKLNSGCLSEAVFTTRQQELGHNGKKSVRKQVWQSGEVYTLEQFEFKSKNFARTRLGDVKSVSPLVVEALFWEAACEKPIYVEYANDVPGSGFGEPTRSSRYLNNRNGKKTRTSRRNCGGSCSIMKPPQSNSRANGGEYVSKVETISSNQESELSSPDREMEGSAGWKLSNSPWNLQVIARSLGSLTRFMIDDIPGVTSPMVYIGMLYSWFAWHVEDHELHSMNFLHTGSQKTWYAVPGDSAFAFEEVICSQAYGENADRLAALTMLGEKTTLLSPEVLIDSGIPCCRLVQNPGEFVVTFPRAYHAGFSHGFNCGEAANFATAKWLEVAKEAAVRRAAMNHLPMLSHQQLLYLLTMSFVSGVPKSLLPGARSSRMKDRQKDERELSVKKAFLDDILSENRLLTTILKISGSNRVVLWDLDSLPSFAKVPERCSTSTTVATDPKDNVSSENGIKNNQDLLRDMSLYMDTVNDLYMDDNDLSGDFQLNSGSLPCVACGILGFPFMAVVQPSESASVNLLLDVGVSKHDHSHSIPFADGLVVSVPDGVRVNIEPYGCNSFHRSNGELEPKFEKGWFSTRGFLRPRIFCLEHAIHIVDMLHSSGGANVLVICHSDFKKMRAHAAIISEQIGTPFRYNEVPLDNAAQDDLNLINLAIDEEEHEEYGIDWTSKVNINLQHRVKLRKNSPSKKEHQYALTLGGLFSNSKCRSEAIDLKWQFTKFRSKCNRKKSLEPIGMEKTSMESSTEKTSMFEEKDQVLVVQSDVNIIRDEVKLIQYSRRRFRCKPKNSIANKIVIEKDRDVAPVVGSGNQRECDIERSLKDFDVKTLSTGDKSSSPSIPIFNGNSGNGLSVSSQTICSVSLETQNAEDNSKDSTTHENKVDKISLNIETFDAENSCFSVVVADDAQHSIVQDENLGFLGSGKDRSSDGIESMKGTSDISDMAPSGSSDSFIETTDPLGEKKEVETFFENTKVADLVETNNGTSSDQSILVSNPSMEVSITNDVDERDSDGYHSSPDKGELDNAGASMVCQKANAKDRSKRRRELDLLVDNQFDFDGFIKSPCEGLRPRSSKHAKTGEKDSSNVVKENPVSKKPTKSLNARKIGEKDSSNVVKANPVSKNPTKSLNTRKIGEKDSSNVVNENPVAKKSTKSLNSSVTSVSSKDKKNIKKCSHWCDIDNCRMKFHTIEELRLHKRNRCPIKGCGKRFTSHKYTIVHQRVHDDERPLKCPWKGCDRSFKWSWSRTEHIRLHTGERPYCCKVKGCGLNFRYISEFSSHKRKTGHYATPSA